MALIVTDAAVQMIAHLGGLRIWIGEHGCCGQSYYFEDGPPPSNPGWHDWSTGGASIYVEQRAAPVLRGARLDFGSRLKPPRFRILRNPNTPQTCPCRRSFGTEYPGPGSPQCRSYEPMPWDGEFEPPLAWVRQTGWAPTQPISPPHAP